MKINKDICFFDAETTGTNPETDRIVELSLTRIFLDGTRKTITWLINPEREIPKEASDIHKITDEMVKDCKTFKELALEIYREFYGSDLFGFNSNEFDIPLMIAEMKRAGLTFLDWPYSLVDVLKLYRKLHPQNLSALFKKYTGEDLENAHSANTDVLATEVVLSHIMKDFFEDNTTPEELDSFIQGDRKRLDIAGKLYMDSEGVVRWAFGKHIDKAWDYDLGFTQWVLTKDFPEDTKRKLRDLLANVN